MVAGAGLRDYANRLWDNRRWLALDARSGDIVISTAYKSGTSWMQRICSLLIFGTPALDTPLDVISPWLDATAQPIDDVLDVLDRQTHRRFIKTHSPLDGLPRRPGTTCIYVGRDPRDVAVSTWHQIPNSRRMSPGEIAGAADFSSFLRDWLSRPGVDGEADGWPYWSYFNHARSFWAGRDRADVILVHFQDLLDDLEGVMRRLAGQLDLMPPDAIWPALVAAARFDAMKADHALTTPGISWQAWKDSRAFFRGGRSGDWRSHFDDTDRALYDATVAERLPSDLCDWLHPFDRPGAAR